jgi:hypothetical protein
MRLLHTLAPAAALLIALTACGQPSNAGAGPAPTSMSNADVLALGHRVAQCYRDNGVAEFPDPTIDDHGQLQLPDNAKDRMRSLYSQQVIDQAQRACQSLFDQLPQSAIGDNNTADVPGPGDVDALRQFAQCARQNGFPDWPDPKADGTFPVRGTPLETEGKSERMKHVFDACRQYWSGSITYS